MQFLTDFADQAVVLPLALLVCVVLIGLRWWRGAVAWVLAVGGVLGTLLVLKLLCAACAGPLAISGVRSPSGHTGSAAVVFGGAVMLALQGRVARPWLLAIPVLFALVFGATRLVLHVHSVGDVIVGGLVGVSGATALIYLAGTRPAGRVWPVAAAVLAVAVVFHGLRLPAEVSIRRFVLSDWIALPAACRV